LFNKHKLGLRDADKLKGVHFLCWNKGYRERLIDSGIKQENIHDVDCLRLNASFKEKKQTKQELAKIFCLDPLKKWVLYAECGESIYPRSALSNMVKAGFEEESILRRNRLIKLFLNAYDKEISRLDDNFFSEYEFIYRPHPGTIAREAMTEAKGIRCIGSLDISHWCSACDFVISTMSTTLCEAEAYGCMSLRYTPAGAEIDDYFLPRGLNQYKTIGSFTELRDRSVEERQEKIYPQIIGEVSHQSISNMANTISQVRFTYQQRISPWKGLYYLSRRVVKLALLNLFILVPSKYLRNTFPIMLVWRGDSLKGSRKTM